MAGFFSFGGPGAKTRNARDIRTTWKVVKLDGPIQKSIGLDASYGVVVSGDEMLKQTQTMLFCPLINGLDAGGRELTVFPWHVPVTLADRTAPAKVEFSRKLVSTKIVLPIAPDEIDRDGLDRGRLDEASQKAVAAKLKLWLPGF